MKRIITTLLAFLMIVTLISCGENRDGQDETPEAATSEETTTDGSETDADTTALVTTDAVTTDAVVTTAVTTEEITTDTEQPKITYKLLSIDDYGKRSREAGDTYPELSVVEKQFSDKRRDHWHYYPGEEETPDIRVTVFSTTVYIGEQKLDEFEWFGRENVTEEDVKEYKEFNDSVIHIVSDRTEKYFQVCNIPAPVNAYYFKSANLGSDDYYGNVHCIYDFGNGIYCIASMDSQGYYYYAYEGFDVSEFGELFGPVIVDAFYQVVESSADDFTPDAKDLIEKLKNAYLFEYEE